MHATNHRDTRSHGIGWLAGTVGGLLLISLGLELLAHQTFGQTDVATFLLAVYLAFWFSVLGIVGFVVLAIAWLVAPRRRRANRVAAPDDLECPRQAMMPVAQSQELVGRQ